MTEGLALDGIRVLDLSSFLPGPFATQILADLGATVLKVERPPAGDPVREILPAMFDSQNRGKFSVSLDLRDDVDRDLLLELAEDAHVLIDGFRPGVLDRLGLGADVLHRRAPELIYVSLSGYGQTGPLAGDSGHNSNYLSRVGFVALSGEPSGPPTDATAVPVADMAAGMYAVIGILASLRLPVTAGRRLDIPLMAAGLAWTAPRLAEYAAKGATHRDDILVRPANGVFATGDGQYVTIAAVEDHFFQGLCQALGRPDLAERPDLARYVDRYAHVEELHEAISERLQTGGRDEWVERLRAAGVPVAPVLAPGEVPDDPQVRHLGLLHADESWRVDQPILGLPVASHPRAPDLGADGAAVRQDGWGGLRGA